MSALTESMNSSVEICLLTINECFVYKVPPLRTASGHRAEDWDLAHPIFTGCLKLFQSGDCLRLVIYAFKDQQKTSVTDENIQTFGECPIVVKPGENILGFVDAVIDSSRYYVVRIKDPKSIRTTLIGIGFREREDAFDLKNSLNEYVKFINRMNLASQLASTPFSDDRMNTKEEGSMLSADVDGGNGEYLSCHSENQGPEHGEGAATTWSHIPALKEGERIKISIGGAMKKSGEADHHKTSGQHSSGTHTPSLLKPPPPAGSVVHYMGGVLEKQQGAVETTEQQLPEDDWGDFKTG